MSDVIDLDHLAIAAEHAFANFARYYGELGGHPQHGGYSPGFHWSQVGFDSRSPDGRMKIEMLEPANVVEFDFLRRFLDRNGPGPHHLTFKVPDLAATLVEVRAKGYEPASENLDSPTWKEAFLHPRQCHGIVVQIAQLGPDADDGEDGADDEEGLWPVDEPQIPPPPAPPARLDHLVHLVADTDAARGLFVDVLGGEPVADGDSAEGRWSELAWPGGGVIRLVEPTGAAKAWMGSRIGRLHHVAFTVADPADVHGARAVGEGVWELAPELNLGVRLRLTRR
ncbi:MAG: VOC family protein [Actinomycetota bacterium]|nr:VOC family protein [Actinomycetota bacterium]